MKRALFVFIEHQQEIAITVSPTDYRINEQISAREVRVIGANNENIGILPTNEALRLAREAGKDLVEVSPNATPPVCRILDFGKFLYERTKKEKEARKAQKIIEVKEIQIRPKSSDFHTGLKVRDARRWLEEGKKVRVRVKFRGREMSYPQLAEQDLNEIAEQLSELAVVEQKPLMEGRTMIMLLAPNPKRVKSPAQPKKEKQERPEPTTGTPGVKGE
ncbi:MAG: translation initiation factor IF-3 [Anaerolineales bacterium]|nr:translation initiation factor IF-3 [Anaerolineales bacterium]